MTEALTLLSFGDGGWGDELLAGLWVTVTLALATLPGGLVAGLLIALGQISSERLLRRAARIYTTVFRGLPELLTIFIVYYGGQMALQALWGMFFDSYFEVNPFVAGMIALGLVFSAYSSEVFLSAFRGIPSGQWEGAAALGLSRWKTFRLVILPQLIRLSIGGLGNLWLILLKETSLVSVIALDELLRQTSVAVGVTKQPILFYSLACAIYLVLSLISARGLAHVERRVNRGEAR